jgi:hypothetical protein
MSDPVEAAAGRRLPVTVRCQGPGVERLELVGPGGVLASAGAGGGAVTVIDTAVEVEASTWLCAVARGPATRRCRARTVAFLAVAREGLEAALFLIAAATTEDARARRSSRSSPTCCSS